MVCEGDRMKPPDSKSVPGSLWSWANVILFPCHPLPLGFSCSDLPFASSKEPKLPPVPTLSRDVIFHLYWAPGASSANSDLLGIRGDFPS